MVSCPESMLRCHFCGVGQVFQHGELNVSQAWYHFSLQKCTQHVGPADVQVDTFDMPLFHSGYCFSQCEVEWCWKMRHGQAVPGRCGDTICGTGAPQTKGRSGFVLFNQKVRILR